VRVRAFLSAGKNIPMPGMTKKRFRHKTAHSESHFVKEKQERKGEKKEKDPER
jgi:hypothetical protein